MTFVWVSDDSNYSAVSSDSFTQPDLNFKKLKREEVWGKWKLYHMAWPHFVPYETGRQNLGEVEGGNLSPKSVDIKRNGVPPHWGQLCKSTVFWHSQLKKWRERGDKWETESRLRKEAEMWTRLCKNRGVKAWRTLKVIGKILDSNLNFRGNQYCGVNKGSAW